jgi:hypothetical protein
MTFGHCEAQTQHASPFPSWATERKERDDRTRVPKPVSVTAPETHGPCSSPPVAKSLVYGPGPGSSWGDRASSPTWFNICSRGSTHLGAARPGPGSFLSFGSLKPGRWDLGPGLAGPMSATAPETHGPYSGPPVAKSLVYGPGPRSSWGDQASSPTRFNTYSRGSTHLGAASPGPSFFYRSGLWNLGVGTWDLDWSGLRSRDSVSKEVIVFGPSRLGGQF